MIVSNSHKGILQIKLCILLSCIFVIHSCQDSDGIKTKNGNIIGIMISGLEGQNLTAYYGIPYAKPPLGELRFLPPRNADNWAIPLEAKVLPLPCIQQFPKEYLELNFSTSPSSEDCLRVNVFVPNPTPTNAPVVVFLHGGGFVTGSSSWWVDLSALTSKGVVVAAVNYRLGVFGFLNLGAENVNGNAGLMDQQMALQWVKDNIQEFGGDPDKITLLGCSAGGASAGFQLLSPGSRGLFKRAIMMSGVPTNSWAIRETKDLIKKSKKLLDTMGCSDVNLTSGIECLRGKHVDEILNSSLQASLFLDEHFLPSVDGHFLAEHPEVSVSAKRFNEADVMIGIVVDDGAEIMRSSNKDIFNYTDGRVNREDFVQLIRKSQISMSMSTANVLNIFYTNWSNPDDPYMLRDVAKDIYTDAMFACKINHFADRLFESGRRVYKYVFDHKSAAAESMPGSQWMRATHGADHSLLLGPGRSTETPQDTQVRQEMMTSFINFIKTGNPNSPEEDFLHWPKYNGKRFHKTFSLPASIGNNFRIQECAPWLKLLPLIQKEPFC